MAQHRNLAYLAAAGFLAVATARAEPPTPDAVVDAFEANLGPITTFRPSHPKGTCAAGHFTATPEGTRLSMAPVFSGQRVPTIIRFGVGGANARVADTARSTRSLSVRFETAAGDGGPGKQEGAGKSAGNNRHASPPRNMLRMVLTNLPI